MAYRPSLPLLLASALFAALPAYLLTNESFRPIDVRVDLEGRDAVRTFALASSEPLFLEYALTMRAPVDQRPHALFALNGATIGAIQPERLDAPERGRILIPAAAVRAGENRLQVTIEQFPSAAFTLEARVHNYYGIAPDFPRVFVVAREFVAYAARFRSAGGRAVRFLIFYLASAIALAAIVQISGRRSGPAGRLLVMSPSFVLWAELLYGLLTPLYIWLSPEALLVSAFVSWLLIISALWLVAHCAPLLRFSAVAMATLLLLELALRLVNWAHPSFVFYTDSYSRFRGQPGTTYLGTRLNSRGFHDVERTLTRPADVVWRVAGIGDSFSVGAVPYQDNYLTLLEKELSRVDRTEVINLGVAATAPDDYLAILVKEGLSYSPDLVLVGFFTGNDFEARSRRAYEYSYAATFGYVLWRTWRASAPTVAALAPSGGAFVYDDDQPTFSRDAFLEIELDRSRIFRRGAAADLALDASRVAGRLREMRDISARAGAPMVVVIIPDQAQVDKALRDEVARASGSDGRDLDFQQPNRLISGELSRSGIRTLDLLPPFLEQSGATSLYRQRDTHWNIAGNRLAAAAIARFLEDQGLGPRHRSGRQGEAAGPKSE